MPQATPADAISAAPRWSGAVLPGCVSTTRPAAAVANPIHSSAPDRSPLTTLHVSIVNCTPPNSTSAPVPASIRA